MQKYMTLLVLKNIQNNYFIYQIHLLDFCLLHYLFSFDNKSNGSSYNAIIPYIII